MHSIKKIIHNYLFLYWRLIGIGAFCLGLITSPAIADVIVDNDGPGTSYAGGGWGYSSGAAPYNGSSRAESLGGATYTFTASVTGYQTVSLWWTYWSSRCSSVPVEIYDGFNLLATVPVNQKQSSLAGDWNVLGTYAFTGTARVVIKAQNGCSTSADAVRFEDGAASSGVIVDNDGPGTSYTGGGWGYSSGAAPYNGSSRAESLGGATYTFTASVTGYQTVSLWWTYWSSRCSSVPVEIYDGFNLLATVPVNQKQSGLAGDWNVLGTYAFTGTARVVIKAQNGCSTNADAVRFVGGAAPVLSYIAVTGAASVNENSSSDYDCIAYYEDGSSREVEADVWSENSAYATISSTGLLTAGGVTSSQAVLVSAGYAENGVTRTDDLGVTILDGTAPAGVIVDNDGPGTSYTGGGWGYSSGAAPYNGSSRAESLGGATYTFTASVTGYQTVSLWWTYWSSRCSSVPVEIYDGFNLLATVPVNQKQSGLAGDWNVLGTYAFTGTARVVIKAQNGCSTNADAVRFEDGAAPVLSYIAVSGASNVNENSSSDYACIAYYEDGSSREVEADVWSENSAYATISSTGLLTAGGVTSSQAVLVSAGYTENGVTRTDDLGVTILDGTAPAGVIVDNDGPGTSYTGGGWGYSSGAAPYNGSSRAESLGGATYTFTASVTGYQTVSLWWTYWPSRCSSVSVSIYRGNQFLSTVSVNQQQPSLAGQWNGIGAFAFTGTARVVIRAQNGCSASADAVRFQLQEGIDNYYVAIGDSITDGFGDDDPSDDISLDGRNSAGGFEPILNNLLTSMTGESHTIVNEGVGGATSSNGRVSIFSVLEAHPESWRFLVQYGTNDADPFFPIPSGLGLVSGDSGYPGTFKDNMQQIIDAINAAGKEVCLAKLPITLGDGPYSPPYVDPDLGTRNILIKEYNDVIDELKNNLLNNISITIPDFYSLFNEDVSGGKRYEFEYADNLHPDGDGYSSVAGGWLEVLIP